LSKAELDQLPFGVIKLGVDGTIFAFNKAERELSHIAHKKMVGKNFFTEIAPCSRVKAFQTRFQQFLKTGKESENFEFTYNFKQGTERVFIFFYRESESIGYVLSVRNGAQADRGAA
jgi:photoactive yellow protein